MASRTFDAPLGARFITDFIDDLNDISPIRQPMIVKFTSSTLNIPTEGRNGFCFHYASSGNYATQLAMAVGDTNLYLRKQSGGTWSDWVHAVISS